MKIKVYNIAAKNGLLYHFVLSAITLKGPDFVKEVSDAKEVDIVITINGTEVDFEKVLEQWDAQMDRIVLEKAKELMNEKMDGIIDYLNDFQQELDNKIDEEFRS